MNSTSIIMNDELRRLLSVDLGARQRPCYTLMDTKYYVLAITICAQANGIQSFKPWQRMEQKLMDHQQQKL